MRNEIGYMWHRGALERHFGDHLKRKRTSFRAIPPQFPWNRPWNFLEVNGSQFRGECNFDVQGSHESFVFDLMHSHSEEDAYPQTTFWKLYLFKLCNFGHRYDSRLLWKENPPKRKPNRFSPWTSQMHISHVQITVFLLLIFLLLNNSIFLDGKDTILFISCNKGRGKRTMYFLRFHLG